MQGVLTGNRYYIWIDLSALSELSWPFIYLAARPVDNQGNMRGIKLLATEDDWGYLGCGARVEMDGRWRFDSSRQLTDAEVERVRQYMLTYSYPHSPLQKDAWNALMQWLQVQSRALTPTERALVALIKLAAPGWTK